MWREGNQEFIVVTGYKANLRVPRNLNVNFKNKQINKRQVSIASEDS